MSDPYTASNGVLRNKLGIDDADKLNQIEADLTTIRAAELRRSPAGGSFNFDHLKSIHAHLFQDVYDWAGKPREGDISKGSTMFCKASFIESMADHIFNDLQKDHDMWKLAPGAFKDEMPSRLAHHFGEINALHPFREGNGRAQKLFIGQLADKHGLTIRWEDMNRKQLIEASIETMSSEPKLLTKLMNQHSEPTKLPKPSRSIPLQ